MNGLTWGITLGLKDGIEFVDLFSGFYLVLMIISLIQLILSLVAIIDIIKNRKFKCGDVTTWILLVLFVQLLGPVLYFTIGRERANSKI